MVSMGSKVSRSALNTEQVGEREREREVTYLYMRCIYIMYKTLLPLQNSLSVVNVFVPVHSSLR